MSEATPTTEIAATEKNWGLLAAQHFGDDFKGQVPAEPQPQEPEIEASEEITQDPAEALPAEIPPEDDATPAPSYEEVDPEWLNSLAVPVKINGVESKATLADLTKSYQITQAAEQRLEEAKAKAKAETQKIAEKHEQLKTHFTIVAGLVEQGEKLITRDFAGVNWEQLRQQDPAEFAAKKAEYNERLNDLARLKQGAINSYQSSQAQIQQESEERRQEYLQQEQELLMQKLPEWKEPEKASTEKSAIAKYLVDSGFSKEDVAAAYDHRMILLARKAMLYDQGQNKAEVVKKKITTIPKVLKPGAPKSQDQLRNVKLKEAEARAARTGSLADAMEVLKLKRKG